MFDSRKDCDQQWIREIHHFDDEHFLILCCTYAQAKAFTRVQCVEMDLSFKMVAGKTNVFSIGGWNEDTKRRFYVSLAELVFDLLIRFRYQCLLLCPHEC